MLRWLGKRAQAPAEEGPEPSIREALLSEQPSDIFVRWARSGYLSKVLPDLQALIGVSQLPAHRDDAFVHTLKVVDAIEPEPVRRWAALLHDIGKGPTFIETPEGRSRFFEHDRIGAEIAREVMEGAGEPPEGVEAVYRLVQLHMRPISYNAAWTDAAVRRLREEAEEGRGEQGWRDLLALAHADLRGYLPEPIDRGLWVLDSLEEHANRIEEEARQTALGEPLGPRSPLDGNELIALTGREPGAWIADLKEYLTSEVAAGRLDRNDKERAEQLALARLATEDEARGRTTEQAERAIDAPVAREE
jgi:poly(A) polymerase